MQISWSLLCCTILQAAFYVNILVDAAQYCRQRNIQISFAAQYCRQRTMQIDMHNICIQCRYYFAAQYVQALCCVQTAMQISWSLICCTILQAAYYVDRYAQYCGSVLYLLLCTILQAAFYVDILVITLLHNIVGSVLCRYLCHYFATILQAEYYDRNLSYYFAAQYCRQRTMQISLSLLC